ncbi:MAG: helix-turn-helix transcriptional regulator [Eubacteriales bacterium]|nr:helix-turn-helix transcriptional regulator [Eubacteriales bacterium]
MNYAAMLDAMIIKSELSLRQITKRCADLDLSITPSYISQLKNGKLPPPSPEVSLALAKACNSKEASKLVFQGYLEKAPEVIKEYMLASSQLNKIMLESLYKEHNDSKMAEEAKEYLNNMDILSTIEMSSKYIKDGKIDFKEDLVKEITLGSGGAAYDGEIINIFLGDSSMSPFIPIHSYISIMPTKPELIKNRDIIAFYPYGKRQAVLRRVYFEKNKILLLPDDRTSDIYITGTIEELNYIGKVISFRVDL